MIVLMRVNQSYLLQRFYSVQNVIVLNVRWLLHTYLIPPFSVFISSLFLIKFTWMRIDMRLCMTILTLYVPRISSFVPYHAFALTMFFAIQTRCSHIIRNFFPYQFDLICQTNILLLAQIMPNCTQRLFIPVFRQLLLVVRRSYKSLLLERFVVLISTSSLHWMESFYTW